MRSLTAVFPTIPAFLGLALCSIHCDLVGGKDDPEDTGTRHTGESGDPTTETGDPQDSGEEDSGFTSCDPFTPDPVPGPDCLSGSLTCGETVTATTVGGSDNLNETLYERNFCFVPYDSFNGAERVYAFNLEPDVLATFSLDSPCSDLDLVVFRWEDETRCPSEDHMTIECEADVSSGGGSVVDLWNNVAARYLVIVDGKQGAEDNFTLSIECRSR